MHKRIFCFLVEYAQFHKHHTFSKIFGHAQMQTGIENYFPHKDRILYLARADLYTQDVEGKQ